MKLVKKILLSMCLLSLTFVQELSATSDELNYLRLRERDDWKDRSEYSDRFDYRGDRRRFYDDYYERRCENQAERRCRTYKDLYWEYIDLSEHYRRLGRMSKYYENRRRADEALEDYRNCISKELTRCRRDYWRDRRGYY